ncbi:MAG: hypothetical protein K5978_03080 [Campylobacter sp.]|nr:hypothetical protein [Campylobacter sp.]
MKAKFYGKKISGILTLLPQTEYSFEEDMKFNSLSEKQNKKLQQTMGYDKHRIFKNDSCVSKIASFGIARLFDKGLLKKQDISALVVCSTTPDFLMPATANIIASELGLSDDIFCMDTNQQCSGFVNGLLQAFMLLNNENMKKIVLVTGDVIGRTQNRSDTSSYPLSGDAICITVLENDETNLPVFFHNVSDTASYDALVFPSMGFRVLSDEEKQKFSSNKYSVYDSLEHIYMDGQAVFQYVMQKVPKYINETLEFAKIDKNEPKFYFFHQPNKFMVDKLAQKLEVPHEKVPSNVVTYYGNSNSSTIPVCICHNAKKEMLNSTQKCVLAGFGAGLSYSGVVMELGEFDFCEMMITEF